MRFITLYTIDRKSNGRIVRGIDKKIDRFGLCVHFEDYIQNMAIKKLVLKTN